MEESMQSILAPALTLGGNPLCCPPFPHPSKKVLIIKVGLVQEGGRNISRTEWRKEEEVWPVAERACARNR